MSEINWSGLPAEPLVVEATDHNKEYWQASGLGRGLEEALAIAEVLLVPQESDRDGLKFYFYQDASALYEFLKEGLGGQVRVELFATDEEYIEVALHSHVHRIGTILVTFVAAPLAINLLSNYVYDVLKAKPEDVVEASVVVEDHECKAFKVTYKGEAKGFATLSDKVGQIARDCEAKAKKARGTKR